MHAKEFKNPFIWAKTPLFYKSQVLIYQQNLGSG